MATVMGSTGGTLQPVGEVTSATGTVVAIGVDGIERRLFSGDTIYVGDLIKTIGLSTIVVAMNDGSRFDLGRNAEGYLDAEVFDNDIGALALESRITVSEMQQAIARGEDPGDIAPAPAAGSSGAASSSIDQGMAIDRTGREGNVTAGFDTIGPEEPQDELPVFGGEQFNPVGGTGGSSGQNAPPVAENDSASTEVDIPVTIAVLDNDSDPDSDAIRVTSATADNGTVTVNPNGTLTYIPNSGFIGSDTISYEINDGRGGAANATVAITVDPSVIVLGTGPANDAPEAVDDTLGAVEDTPLTLSTVDIVDPNDTDLDGDTLTITSVGGASNGTVDLNPDGTVTFTPAPNYSGPASFTYTIDDGNGGSDTATVTVNVAPANDAPEAVDDTLGAVEDTPLTLSTVDIVDPNDTDLDGDTLTITSVGGASNGTVDLNPDGTVTFTPAPNYSGPASFTYTIDDGNGGSDTATVTVNVAPANDAPEAVDDTLGAVEDTPLTLSTVDIVDPNDTDLDGDTLTITSVGGASNGTVDLNPDGTVTFTPAPNYSGPASFTYTIDDGNGGSDTATVTVNVAPANDAPEAVDDTLGAVEDTPLTLSTVDIVDPNDTDLDGDTLTITSVGGASNGTVDLNPDGTVTFTPAPNYSGPASFTYTIDDGNGGSDTATVTVNVAPANDAPEAVDDTLGAVEDTPLTLSTVDIVDPNDTDLDGDTLTITSVGGASNGTVDLNPDGTVTFTPAPNYSGPASFTYTIDDGNGGSDTATVTVNVAPANDAPEAVDDTLGAVEDTPLTLSTVDIVDPNDTDLDGDTLTITSVGGASNGTVDLNPDGTVTFTPAPNYSGPASFTYTIDDGNGGSDTATVTVNVAPANDAPEAVDDTLGAVEDTPLTLSTVDIVDPNDTDLDGDTLTITSVGGASNGTVDLNPDGTVTFTPAPNYSGPASFTYTIDDGNGGSDTATVTVNVAPANDAPEAVDDTLGAVEDTPLTLSTVDIVDPNDTDLDGDTLTITSVGGASNGTVDLNPDGTVTFTPAPNYSGPASFTYTIDDGNGGSDTATVTVNVAPANDAPEAVDDTLGAVEDTPLTLSTVDIVDPNDTDLDGDTLTITSVGGASNGTVDLNPDGTVTFTPAPNYSGPASFTYTIDDGNGGSDTATVTVNVAPANDAPEAVDDTLGAVEDTPLTLSTVDIVDPNDTDLDGDTLTITSVGGASNGTVDLNPDGTVTFTPAPNYSGPASFTYTIDDGNGGSDTATVTVNVAPANDAPEAVDDTLGAVEDTPLTLSTVDIVDPNDTDLDGDTLTITSVGGASNGTVDLNPDGTVTFTPAPNYSGPASFTYTIDDGNGGSDTATVTVNVAPANDAPEAVDDTLGAVEDTPLTLSTVDIVDPNDTDLDGDTLTITSVGGASNGTVDLNPDGTVTFTPAPNYSGPASFTYTIDDGNGGSDTATVTVNVAPANDAPEAVDDTLGAVEDTPLTLSTVDIVDPNDTDLDGDTLTITSVGGASNGTVDLEPRRHGDLHPGAELLRAGELHLHHRRRQRRFGHGDGDGQRRPANDAPEAVDDTLGAVEDTPLTLSTVDIVDPNDTDLDGDTLTITSVGGASNGTVDLNPDGTVTFTPAPNYSGPASFTYTIDDGNGGSDTATVTVNVAPANDAPEAVDDTLGAVEDTPLTLSTVDIVDPNDTDLDGDTLTITSVGGASNGTVDLNPDGTVTFTPAPNYSGPASSPTPSTTATAVRTRRR